MIPYSETENPRAVDQHFSEKFESLKRHPLDKETMSLLVSLIMTPGEDEKMKSVISDVFILKIIQKRIEVCMSYTMDDRSMIFLGYVAESPGMAIMYLYYLARWAKNNDCKRITLEIMCERIFPWGCPSKEDLHKVWDEQKVHREIGQSGTDNLLDYPKAALSLQF